MPGEQSPLRPIGISAPAGLACNMKSLSVGVSFSSATPKFVPTKCISIPKIGLGLAPKPLPVFSGRVQPAVLQTVCPKGALLPPAAYVGTTTNRNSDSVRAQEEVEEAVVEVKTSGDDEDVVEEQEVIEGEAGGVVDAGGIDTQVEEKTATLAGDVLENEPIQYQ